MARTRTEKRALKRRYVLLAAALGWHCGPAPRRAETVTVIGDVAYNETLDRDYGCEGEVVRQQQHRSLGGSAAVRYEHPEGASAGARLRVMGAETVRTRRTEDGPADGTREGGPSYALAALTAHGGWDWRNLGGTLGVGLVTTGALDAALFVPYAQLRAGQIDGLWGELTVGAEDPLFFLNLMALGAAVRLGEGFTARVGGTLHGKVVRDALGMDDGRGVGNLRLGVHSDDVVDPGGYLELRYAPPSGGFGVEVGALGAAEPAFKLGLSYTLPVD